MALSAKNRKKVEKLVFDTLMKLEPNGANARQQQEAFKKMSDKEFLDFFKRIRDDPNSHFYVEMDLYGKNRITTDSVEAACNFLNVPTEEYYYIKHKDPSGKPMRSKVKVPVMYIHLKRMQQLLSKKVRINTDIDSGGSRSSITGGLNSSAKTGRFTDADLLALTSVTSDFLVYDASGNSVDPITYELLRYRGDNDYLRNSLKRDIALNGNTSLASLEDMAFGPHTGLTPQQIQNHKVGQSVVTLDEFYLAAGMITDLVTDTPVLDETRRISKQK